jgi:hypothetical protein
MLAGVTIIDPETTGSSLRSSRRGRGRPPFTVSGRTNVARDAQIGLHVVVAVGIARVQ